jgi:hypothetical protein
VWAYRKIPCVAWQLVDIAFKGVSSREVSTRRVTRPAPPYDAVKIFMPARAKQPVVVHYTEHCPPDVGAAFIWLKNRDPERWRDVQNVEHVMGKYIISDRPMTIEQWAAERATVVNEVIDDVGDRSGSDDSVTRGLPNGIEQRKKGQ